MDFSRPHDVPFRMSKAAQAMRSHAEQLRHDGAAVQELVAAAKSVIFVASGIAPEDTYHEIDRNTINRLRIAVEGVQP